MEDSIRPANSTELTYYFLFHFFGFTAEGIKGFYKGIIPTTAKAVVATAVTFAAYEVIHKLYHIIPYHIIPYHIISYNIISHHIIPNSIMSYHILLYYIILHLTTLYHIQQYTNIK